VPSKPDVTASKSDGRLAVWRRAGRWLCAGDRFVAVGMALLVIYYLATPGVFQGKASGDGWFGFQYLRAIVFKQTLDMQSVLPQYLPYFGTSGPGHHMPNRCPFGPTLVWLPFYLVACALHGLGALLRLLPPGVGESPFDTKVTGLGTLAAVLLAWRYLYVLVERHAGRAAARIGSTAAIWATPIVWYAVTQPFYQHGLALATTAVLVERWDATRGDASWRRMLVLGLVGGLGMSFRAQEGLWLLLPGLEAAWHVVRGPGRTRWLVAGLVLTGATLVAFLPQMLVWWYYTGSPLTPAQVEPLRWSTPFFAVSLFSTRGGLFPWSPVFYAAVAGLVLAKRSRPLLWMLTAIFALDIYVVASAWVTTGGYGYGARRLSDGVVWLALAIGLGWARLESVTWARRTLAVFVGFCIVLNVATMELLRGKAIPSSGAYARSAQRFLDDLHAPAPLGRFFGAVGYPFVQPAGWLFALYWHAPVTAFEGIVGNWLLDRDGQWLSVQTHLFPLTRGDAGANVLGGLTLSSDAPARVDGPVRMLLPMFASEPIGVRVLGDIPAGERAAQWNGLTVPVANVPGGVRFDVPATAVNAGVNELRLTLPVGAQLQKLDFSSSGEWWSKKRAK
jgi:hypothetical protein